MKFGNRIVTDGLVFAVDAANPISYPGSGNAWNDLTPNKNNGTLTNGPTFNSANAGSIVFDGVNDKVTVGNTPLLRITGDITIMAAIKFHSPFQHPREIVSKWEADTQREFEFRSDIDGKLAFLDNNGKKTQNANLTIPLDTIAMAGVTRNLTTNKIEFFINGQSDGQVNYSGNVFTSNADVGIGCRASIDFGLNNLNIYLVHIYNRALSSSEVLQNYNALKGRFGL